MFWRRKNTSPETPQEDAEPPASPAPDYDHEAELAAAHKLFEWMDRPEMQSEWLLAQAAQKKNLFAAKNYPPLIALSEQAITHGLEAFAAVKLPINPGWYVTLARAHEYSGDFDAALEALDRYERDSGAPREEVPRDHAKRREIIMKKIARAAK